MNAPITMNLILTSWSCRAIDRLRVRSWSTWWSASSSCCTGRRHRGWCDLRGTKIGKIKPECLRPLFKLQLHKQFWGSYYRIAIEWITHQFRTQGWQIHHHLFWCLGTNCFPSEFHELSDENKKLWYYFTYVNFKDNNYINAICSKFANYTWLPRFSSAVYKIELK